MSAIYPESIRTIHAIAMLDAVSLCVTVEKHADISPPHRAEHTPSKPRGSSRGLRFLLHPRIHSLTY